MLFHLNQGACFPPKKKLPHHWESFFTLSEAPVLQLANFLRGRTFGPGDHFEADPIALGQRFEPLGLDRGMMHENVLAPVLFDKAESL